ncbi:HNH endonuclease [Singulisphaera sp. GP187]|uniref:HNH endonuclease n=1 Tax=Singulisphaera sp. GP187 TaxID=1882752 RepID=UPI000926E1EB|nr:HNH endonuclease [Singulisphaera sp. GP187]SIO25790.1 HNH endonuclease [Singulisphaera sp. GP187]
MPFIVDESYTRDHIHEQLGGEKVSYLPQKDGKIVCGCFSWESNPDAPEVILVGGDENGVVHPVEKKARILEKQEEPIPVFLKQASNDWIFKGYFQVKETTRDRKFLDEKQRKAGRDDVVMALILEPAASSFATYLLTWNPNTWSWASLENEVGTTAEGRPVDHRWSCGSTKRIRVGDRLFLLRQGVEPKGIVAAGWATSTSYEGPHWDQGRKSQGATALLVDVRFERILNPESDEILPLVKLQVGALASVNWMTPASGIQIKRGCEELERLWADHMRFYQSDLSDVGQDGAIEGELRVAMSRHRARERWLRDSKIAEVKQANDGRLPCHVCTFDFFKVYGDIGRAYAQVHHLKPLGDRTRPSLTKLSDLAVLCANCHIMVHIGNQVRPLEGLLAVPRS